MKKFKRICTGYTDSTEKCRGCSWNSQEGIEEWLRNNGNCHPITYNHLCTRENEHVRLLNEFETLIKLSLEEEEWKKKKEQK